MSHGGASAIDLGKCGQTEKSGSFLFYRTFHVSGRIAWGSERRAEPCTRIPDRNQKTGLTRPAFRSHSPRPAQRPRALVARSRDGLVAQRLDLAERIALPADVEVQNQERAFVGEEPGPFRVDGAHACDLPGA